MPAVLSNAWLGVSAESQRWAKVRLPLLAETPAAVRFASCEPLFGALDIRPWLAGGLDWVIVGGESGPGARPMDPRWARSMRDQCVAADVSFFFKQWGAWAPSGALAVRNSPERGSVVFGELVDDAGHRIEMRRVGKKAAGRLLDGRVWDEFPRSSNEAGAVGV